MNKEPQNQTERVRDAQTIAQLKELSQKLLSDDINQARLAAHRLSWMQEDGFTLLKLGLFGRYSRNTKKAAAYGLRSMKGRMKKAAIELLTEGLRDRDRTTKAACKKALQLMKILPPSPERKPKPGSRRPQSPQHAGGRKIQGISSDNEKKRPNPNTIGRH
jgi:hypothetical protein